MRVHVLTAYLQSPKSGQIRLFDQVNSTYLPDFVSSTVMFILMTVDILLENC